MKGFKVVLSLALAVIMFASSQTIYAISNDASSETAGTSSILERERAEEVVINYFDSLINKDSDLYLKSIANSESDANQYNSKLIGDYEIDYNIVDIAKINDSKYVVKVIKNQNGIDYPVIPYDVVLEGSGWKIDPSNIIFYPKQTYLENKKFIGVTEINIPDLVSQNENFFVGKIPSSDIISPFDFLTYNFNSYSTDIYSSSVIGIETLPGSNDEPDDSYNWVQAAIYKKLDTGELVEWSSKSVSAFNKEYVTFQFSGYCKAKATNFNYPWLSGKFNVVW